MVAHSEQAQYWWERRWYITLLLFLAATPLLWPQFPPWVDLPGHMGRYEVQLNPDDPILARFYGFEWKLIANLGVDILIIPMASIFGVELGTKLIVIATMVASAAGLLWIAKEVHGRLPPTAALAIPFIYGYVATFGFLNYMLSIAIAFNLFALWMFLARKNRTGFRTLIMLPLSFVLAFCHIFGWGVLGVLVFGWELSRLLKQNDEDRGDIGLKHIFLVTSQAAFKCWPLYGPFFLLILWRINSAPLADIDHGMPYYEKYYWVAGALRDRWSVFDRISIFVIVLAIGIACRTKWLKPSSPLTPALLIFCILYLVFPPVIFGSYYSDMRLVPYVFALALVAIGPPSVVDPRRLQLIAMLALSFCLVRIAGNAASYALYDRELRRELQALDVIPSYARLVHFVSFPCAEPWASTRKEHLGSIALVRKHAYANDQWALSGAQLIETKINAPGYEIDTSQVIYLPECGPREITDAKTRLTNIPRDKFDFIWLINIPPDYTKWLNNVTEVWRDGDSAVYRINKPEIDTDKPNV